MDLRSLLNDIAINDINTFYIAENGQIKENAVPTIIGYINQELQALYTRYRLSTKSLILLCYAQKTEYPLLPRFAEQSDSSEQFRYILDTPSSPFTGDIVKILEVFSEFGYRLPLNDSGHAASIYTPSYNTLQVPRPTGNTLLTVNYQALHPKIELNDDLCCAEFLDQRIFLDRALQDILLTGVAIRTFSTKTGKEITSKLVMLQEKYEGLLEKLESNGLINGSSFTTHSKLESRGFV